MTRSALCLLLLLAACATGPTPTLSGVYSDIYMSPETGDLGGVEMELDVRGPDSTVVFTRCEGGCYGGKTWPVAIEGDTISFSVIDDWFDQDGKLSERTTKRYLGTFDDGALLLTSPDEPDFRGRLKRVPNPTPGHTEELATFGQVDTFAPFPYPPALSRGAFPSRLTP